MNHNRRRKKQRPNYGRRTVDVCRSSNGFGFTISGQKPCILSCIVQDSPADLAGLHAGDFLISVNGQNVSKLPHEIVVQLINDSIGTIRLTIAENYYSDTSDEDGANGLWNNGHTVHDAMPRMRRPKFPHHKLRLNRSTNQNALPSRKKVEIDAFGTLTAPLTDENLKATKSYDEAKAAAHNIIHSSNARNDHDVRNVSAMVAPLQLDESPSENVEQFQLEYRTVIGYLGTIEMPKQIATSSKLQTVRSCIRKMRQEKRQPTIVLMQILPNCLKLYNSENVLIAKYPSSRLSYVSCNHNGASAEVDMRFFGLVTSAVYADGKICESATIKPTDTVQRNDVIISNSCHVFVVDLKLIDHSAHFERAEQFSIVCTKDPVANCCLEFPTNSDYVVNLIRSMYTLSSDAPPPVIDAINNRHFHRHRSRNNHHFLDDRNNQSPQPSNHSEITTTSSNSDSGIGFHNDFTNISDRIVVVDFPGENHIIGRPFLQQNGERFPCNARPIPFGADSIRNIRSKADYPVVIHHVKSRSLDSTHQLSPQAKATTSDLHLIRAMPDPKPLNTPNKNNSIEYEVIFPKKDSNEKQTKIQQYGSINELDQKKNRNINRKNSLLLVSKSCDDISVTPNHLQLAKTIQIESYDDVSLLGEAPPLPTQTDNDDDYVFLAPQLPFQKRHGKKPKSLPHKPTTNTNKTDDSLERKMCQYKLSPKVFGISNIVKTNDVRESKRRLSMSNELEKCKENMTDTTKTLFNVWGSLQDLEALNRSIHKNGNKPSENDETECIAAAYSEPDLTSRTLPNQTSTFRRWGRSSTRSRTTEVNHAPKMLNRRLSSGIVSENDVYAKSTDRDVDAHSSYEKITETSSMTSNNSNVMRCVDDWGNSFEKLLEDPAGLHTFAIFLQKEFSAENIYFWTACERYRKIDTLAERKKAATLIFAQYLASGALEPVNVDSKAASSAEENLSLADKDLFILAQKQIFNLMKFDSYQRFIRSDLYKLCIEAEAKKLPLPYPGNELDPNLRITPKSPEKIKLKKSLSNAEDRRRKSLLPWHRKTRCKSKDRSEESGSEHNNSTLKKNNINGINDVHSSRSSLSSFDTAFSLRNNDYVNDNIETEYGDCNDDTTAKSSLCRIILANGATTIVQTRPNETFRDLVDRSLEKRGINYLAYEGFIASGGNKSIILDEPSTLFAGKEIFIEQRVVFKLDLPNKKIISVKSKPGKLLVDVLRPILNKYNYDLEHVTIFSKNSTEEILKDSCVIRADGLRLQVVSNEEENDTSSNGNISDVKTVKSQNTLYEITNKVFNELRQQKVESHSMNILHKSNLTLTSDIPQQSQTLKPDNDDNGTKSDDWNSQTSSNNFSQLKNVDTKTKPNVMNRHRRIAAASPSASKMAAVDKTECVEDSSKKPIIAVWKSGVKLQNTTTASGSPANNESNDLLEGLKRAQRFRLEDQRGTEINFELPDFLKDSGRNRLRKVNKLPFEQNQSLIEEKPRKSLGKTPQPAPRLSITKHMPINEKNDCDHFLKDSHLNASQMSTSSSGSSSDRIPIDNLYSNTIAVTLSSSDGSPQKYFNDPPPLPPKPKLKFSQVQWVPNVVQQQKIEDLNYCTASKFPSPRTIYLDQTNSSIV